ncbi:hypothetical protein CIC12_04055 [Burkholderia sp. SG-MS1]|uniref:hypothetical protein n=1 Tax=Paraburkholderia sp. SG-MS1 TaxID=2023741 RepID=UPI001446A04F|nr:hypothetical protein [Paraburkholderia sp. SG-MS1]NKJ45927.1 hypothetical protein [Paraburkholderia sp. SG-MS1]
MQTCPVLRASRHDASHEAAACPTSSTRASRATQRWLTVATTLAGWLGGRALRDLLDAIPDSNDDFGLF